MSTLNHAIRAAHLAKLGITCQAPRPTTNIRAAAAKASATKGAAGHKRAGLKAKITRLSRHRETLTGYAKGQLTKAINALSRELEALG